jgi:hypothetical protein
MEVSLKGQADADGVVLKACFGAFLISSQCHYEADVELVRQI